MYFARATSLNDREITRVFATCASIYLSCSFMK